MEYSANSEVRQQDSPYTPGPGQSFRRVRLEHILRKAWADGWARKQKEGTIAAEVLRAVRTAFPDMGLTEASAAIERLREPSIAD